MDFVVSRAPQPKTTTTVGKTPTGRPARRLYVTELVAMDDTGPEAIKVTTAGQPKGAKRQLVTVVKLVVTPWNIDDRCGGHSAPTRSHPYPPLRRLRPLPFQGPALPQVPEE